jgi:hypothetical protein
MSPPGDPLPKRKFVYELKSRNRKWLPLALLDIFNKIYIYILTRYKGE